MKLCPKCQTQYPDDANFCPKEECASADGPQRLTSAPSASGQPGRFTPISRIGGTSSGEVWQANDAESGAAVAYKVVHSGALTGGPLALERAQRELKQLQRASSTRIGRIVDFGKTPENQLFVASELIDGEPLDRMVARTGPLALDRAKRIVAQIGEALLEAQKVGVIHRDLAAKNVLVSPGDEVKVINFTVPRPLNSTVVGVPEYLSPEQADGKLVDQRSNTYSLGAIFYFLLIGEPPHRGSTPEETLEAVRKAELVPPSVRRPGLPPDVDRVLLKALDKTSSRRPLTMRQFLSDLASLATGDAASSPSAARAGGAPAGTPGAPGAGAAGGAGGFARTMVFAGGAGDVQKLVASVAAQQASAHGAATNGQAPPVQPTQTGPDSAPTPSVGVATTNSGPAAVSGDFVARPVGPAAVPGSTPGGARPAYGAAVSNTAVATALPTSQPISPPVPGASPLGPLPAGPLPAPASAAETAPDAAHAPESGGAAASLASTPPSAATGFRETLWFKKGDVEQMVAEARAKAAAAAAAKAGVRLTPLEVPAEESAAPLEDRYVDDGSLTAEDRKKFSLASGATAASANAAANKGAAAHVPGERMSDTDMVEEMGRGRRIAIIVMVIAVALAIGAVVAISLRGKGDSLRTDPGAAAQPSAPAAQPADPAAAAPADEGSAAAARPDELEPVEAAPEPARAAEETEPDSDAADEPSRAAATAAPKPAKPAAPAKKKAAPATVATKQTAASKKKAKKAGADTGSARPAARR